MNPSQNECSLTSLTEDSCNQDRDIPARTGYHTRGEYIFKEGWLIQKIFFYFFFLPFFFLIHIVSQRDNYCPKSQDERPGASPLNAFKPFCRDTATREKAIRTPFEKATLSLIKVTVTSFSAYICTPSRLSPHSQLALITVARQIGEKPKSLV